MASCHLDNQLILIRKQGQRLPSAGHVHYANGHDFDRSLAKWLHDGKAVELVGDNLNLSVIPHAALGQVEEFNWFARARISLSASGCLSFRAPLVFLSWITVKKLWQVVVGRLTEA